MAEPFGLQSNETSFHPQVGSALNRLGYHDNDALLQLRNQRERPQTPGFPLLPVQFAPPREAAPVNDTPANIQNGVLSVRVGDRNIDRALARNDYYAIKIDPPPGASVQNWADANGYYMWFRNDANGQSLDGQKHYYPPNAKQLVVNGQPYDLEAQRLKVNEDMATAANGGRPLFQSLDRRISNNPWQVVQYATGMASLGAGVLNAEEAALTESVRSSNNPYFKIYLADVYVAQAMQPIMDQVRTTGHMDLTNPQTVGRIDAAIRLLNQASTDSRGGLSRINAEAPGNVTMPLDPYEIYMSNGYQPLYGFWAGSRDQALCRAATLTTLRNLITSQALASVMRNIEVLPPR
jgi:hypothetical protein